VSLPPSSSFPPPDPPRPAYGQQPYGQPPYGGGGYDPNRPSKAFAGWSLGLAIVPSCVTWIISIVFACIVISRSKDGREHGKKMAVAALIIIGVWILIGVAVVIIVSATDAERDDSGRVTDGGRSSVLDLRVGDCLPDPGSTGKVRSIDLVECDQPHRAEVYALFDLEGDYTTQDEVTNLAEAGCFDRFKAYVGVGPARSTLDILYLTPVDEFTFNQDPGVSCVAVATEDLTSTLKGSKR
jgi:hypothetical protein